LSLPSVPSTDKGPSLQCSDGATIPDIAKTPSGFNCEPLNDQLQVRWAVMGNEIAFELVGQVEETEWMGFGVSGSSTKTFMVGADPTVVDMYNGTFRARDFYLNNRSQCSGINGVCPDSRNGTDDVKKGSVNGDRDQGITVVRYIRPLIPSDIDDSAPSDSRIDRSISVTSRVETYIVWAIGPVSPDTGLPQFHSVWPQGVDFKLEFGRAVTDNCEPFVGISDAPTATPEPYDIPVLKDVTEIVARIGPSGGERVCNKFCS
jgi:DOMON domain